MTAETRDQEYVLVPKTKHRLTRARKFIIGFMAIGSVAAITGAGTFASFSASTTNDASFTTEKLFMRNTANGGTACESNSTSTGNTVSTINNSGAPAAASNDGTCDSLFTTTTPGNQQDATVVIQNDGDAAHNIMLWFNGACSDGANNGSFAQGSNNLCSNLRLAVWKPGTANCLFPAGNNACDGTNAPNLSTVGTPANFLESAMETYYGTSFASAFTANHPVLSALGAGANSTVKISIYLPHDSTCGASPYTLNSSGATTSTTAPVYVEGYNYNSSGTSCDNKYINKKATMALKWYMSV